MLFPKTNLFSWINFCRSIIHSLSIVAFSSFLCVDHVCALSCFALRIPDSGSWGNFVVFPWATLGASLEAPIRFRDANEDVVVDVAFVPHTPRRHHFSVTTLGLLSHGCWWRRLRHTTSNYKTSSSILMEKSTGGSNGHVAFERVVFNFGTWSFIYYWCSF